MSTDVLTIPTESFMAVDCVWLTMSADDDLLNTWYATIGMASAASDSNSYLNEVLHSGTV